MSEIFSGNQLLIENLGNSKAAINKIGMSWQEIREGYNELKTTKVYNNMTYYGVTCTTNDDGTITLNGTASQNTEFHLQLEDETIDLQANENYILKRKLISGTASSILVAYMLDSAHGTFNTESKNLGVSENVRKIKMIRVYINANETFNNARIGIMLCKGATEKPFELYGAMPSPEFRSEIKNVTGSAKIIVCNENLFDSKAIPEMSGTTYGVECKIDNDGIITLSSNTNSAGYLSTRRILRELCPKLKEGDVAYLFLETTHATKGIWLYNVEMMWSANTSKIITKEMLDGIVSIYGGNKQTDTIKIMITSNKLATEYKPHQSQTFLFPLKEGQKLFKDSYLADDGVHHTWREYIITGNEGWILGPVFSGVVGTRFDAAVYTQPRAGDNEVICTHYAYNGTNKKGCWVNAAVETKALDLRIQDETITTVKDLTAFLQEQYANGTPVTIQYPLAEEIIEPYTPEQENIYMQLQNMELYEGINYVFVKGEPYVEIEVTVNKLIEDYDAYISATGRLIVPSLNINYLVDFNESNIPTMPEAVESSVRAAGRDGDIVLNTTYEPIPFNIVCYTEDNLTLVEKVEEEKKVNKLLNSIKNGTMTFALEKSNKFYNVKYSGALTTINYPKHLKFSIPLKASDSYGKDLIKKSIVGNSIGESETAEKVGALFILRGPATNPIIALNDYSMEYGMAILEGARVEIDSNKSTITHINSSGIKTNVMKYYNHQFPKIENGINELKILSGFDSDMQVSVIWNDLKL